LILNSKIFLVLNFIVEIAKLTIKYFSIFKDHLNINFQTPFKK